MCCCEYLYVCIVPALSAEPILSSIDSRLSIAPGNIAGHVISCTGAQFCPVAIG